MQSIGELEREFTTRANAVGLRVDCAMDGAFNAQVALVGEAPGEREVYMKVPLVGSSGQLAWKTLATHKITRRDVYITNAVKRQLAFAERNEKIRLPRNEIDHWEALLKWELANLPNLKYILILGNFGLKMLLDKDGITRWRGSVLNFSIESHNDTQPRDYTAVCTFNPAHVLREPRSEISFIMDCAKLPMVMSGRFKPYEISADIITDGKLALEILENLHASESPISFDIETGSRETACIGFANSAYHGWCIPFRSITGGHYFPIEEEVAIRQKLQSLFDTTDNNRRFVAQNANFDMYWLWYKDRIRVHKTWLDTMLAHHCLYPTLPHDLGYLCTQYTTHPYYKDERIEWRDKGDIDAFWRYNVTDCCITWEVARKLEKELIEQGLDQFFFNHIMRLQPHLVRMTVGGVKIDVEQKEQITIELREDVAKLLSNVHDKVELATGNTAFRPNPLSRPDMSRLLFTELRLIGRGTSTDATNRERMYSHPKTSQAAKDVIRAIDKYKEEHKFLSTYAESAIDDDGRMRCEWKQTGVSNAPGRLSSAKVLWGTGMNLQNQPPRARSMFITDPDYVFIYFDLTQAEAQYVAWDARIDKWKRQYTKARLEGSGYDAHRALASDLFKVPYDQVPAFDHYDDGRPTIRYKAKRARHGLNYRMAADRLAVEAGIPLSEAVELYTLYHRNTPELRKWWAASEHEVRTTKQLFNAYGRRLYFLERLNDPDALESIVAFKPQSTIGDKVSRVIYLCHDDDEWPTHEARIALNVHDALIGIAHKSIAKTCLSIMKRHAEEPILIRGEQLVITAELGLSQPDEQGVHRWSTIKKIKEL